MQNLETEILVIKEKLSMIAYDISSYNFMEFFILRKDNFLNNIYLTIEIYTNNGRDNYHWLDYEVEINSNFLELIYKADLKAIDVYHYLREFGKRVYGKIENNFL